VYDQHVQLLSLHHFPPLEKDLSSNHHLHQKETNQQH
jgi:hypothetical protein